MKKSILLIVMAIIAGTLFTTELQAQDELEDKGPRYGEDSVTCVMNISLYREFFKQWKASKYKNTAVNDAIGPWRQVFLHCPLGTKNAYLDGEKMIEYMIKKQSDEAMKEAYIDTLMMLYDQRIMYFGEKGFVLGKKGIDLYKYRTKELEAAYNIFDESVAIDGNKSKPSVLVYYFRTTVKMAEAEKIEETLIFENFDKIMAIIDYNLKNSKKTSSWQNIKANIEKEFEPLAKCENLIPMFAKKFEANPEDIEQLKKMTDLLDKKKCVDSELYYNMTVKLYELEPSAEAAYLIGKINLKNMEYAEAVKYFEQATTIEDQDKLAETYYFMALCYQNMNNNSQARSYALKSIGVNPNLGDRYILIGDLYGASAKSCGDEFESKCVYWVAVDKYMQAKRMDPSVAEIANSRIASYSAHFPTTEEIFFHDLNKGDEYTVECWINEKTTVRAAK